MKHLTAIALGILFVLSLSCYAADKDDVVVFFPFDEGSGDTTKDESPKAFIGQINGAEWVDGKIGKALEFNGTDSHVLVPPIENPMEEFSIEFWFKPSEKWEAGAGRQDMIYKDQGAGCPHISFDREGDGTIGFYTRATGRVNININTTINSWDANWYHTVATQSTSMIAIYINGKLENKMESPAVGPAVADYGEFGISIGGAGNYFAGVMDELRIWSTALDAAEVEKLFKGTHPILAVEPRSKLSTVWGCLKQQ